MWRGADVRVRCAAGPTYYLPDCGTIVRVAAERGKEREGCSELALENDSKKDSTVALVRPVPLKACHGNGPAEKLTTTSFFAAQIYYSYTTTTSH